MLVKRISLVSLLASLAVIAFSCAPSIIGSDGAVYSWGKLYAVSSRDMTGVYQATLNALASLELEVTEKAKDVFYAKVVARGADGKMITVRIEPGVGGVSDFSIKVGAGDKYRSSVIYEQIRRNLGFSVSK